MDPCRHGPTKCGTNAQCSAQDHQAACTCPAGTQGNPLIACVTGQCQYNEDCRDDEACDRLNRVCRPVCHSDDCAPSAKCVGRNHQPVCTCPEGSIGNPYVDCHRPQNDPQPECLVDADCPTQHACIGKQCTNPCKTTSSNVCGPEQQCTVFDSLPLRTIICTCPTDTITNERGQCVPPPIRQADGCEIDADCPNTDKCLRGQCEQACRIERCGVNAQCEANAHRAVCSCAPGYTGNPFVECSSCK